MIRQMVSYLFCSPQQFLLFLPILAGISTIVLYYRDQLKEKLLKIIVSLVLFSYLMVFINLESGFILFLILALIFVVLVWKKRYNATLFLLTITSAYLIAGVTGNACLYLPSGSSHELVLSKEGSTLGIVGLQNLLPEESNACNLIGIGINDFGINGTNPYHIIGPNDVFVSFFDNNNGWFKPYKTISIEKGEDFTFCCETWTLVDMNESHMIWNQNSNVDIFCFAQNTFYAKGVYRTS